MRNSARITWTNPAIYSIISFFVRFWVQVGLVRARSEELYNFEYLRPISVQNQTFSTQFWVFCVSDPTVDCSSDLGTISFLFCNAKLCEQTPLNPNTIPGYHPAANVIYFCAFFLLSIWLSLFWWCLFIFLVLLSHSHSSTQRELNVYVKGKLFFLCWEEAKNIWN